jgi:hypothetical protein
MMPIALLKDPSIAAESKVLAGLLISYQGPMGCFPKISSLMKDLGVSKHTVIRCLEELERYGFLTRERRGRNNAYNLTPAYVQPTRPDDITVTGELSIENARPAKPVKRKTLHKRRPDPTLPLTAQPVAPEQPIPITRRKRDAESVALVQPITESDADVLVSPEQPGYVAPVLPVAPDRLHESNLDITEIQTRNYIQQQQKAAAGEKPNRATIEYTLIEAGVAPIDSVTWAIDLDGLDLADIRDALKIMRSKPAYRRREIDRPGAYMRVLAKTQVHQERELAAHEARKSRPAPTHAAPVSAPAEVPRVKPAARETMSESAAEDQPKRDALDLLDELPDDVAEQVRTRAMQLCRGGSSSPAWRGAVSIALHQYGLSV